MFDSEIKCQHASHLAVPYVIHTDLQHALVFFDLLKVTREQFIAL
jgi:hypothetical protein